MKVVLSGYYGFHNVGDEAILYSIITALRNLDEKIHITVLSNDPAYTEKTYGVAAVNRWKMKEVIAAIRESDGLISGGGSLLQDKTGNRSVIYYTGVMMIAKMVGKPFFIYAQGIGPISKGFNQKLTKFVLSKASGLTVRDEESLQFLRTIGVKKEISLVPDPVLGIELEDRTSPWFEYKAFTKPVISVSVRDWDAKAEYKQKIATALDQLAAAGNEVVLVPMHGIHDHETSKEVTSIMKEKTHIAPHDLSIEEKIALIGKTDLLIGMRLHALIFSAVVETPFIAISYDPKIDSFANLANQPVIGHVDHDNWTSNDLFETATSHLANKSEEIAKMKQYVDVAKQQARDTAGEAVRKFRI
ncbi:polysaccharide pyruvyl transferase CsaB [Anaerobacillus sp. MEB173]|uniref:polysaccharide pyruvyl transferase CsaB n=1 Tax=Anaerobacillus sp. MEB173 TaxID=3383345 RepID=UPI003F93C72F